MNADMQSRGGEVTCLRVDGGASANDLLMQMQSDFSGIDVQRASTAEATALGAAFLAGLAVGFFRDRKELKTLVSAGRTFVPKMNQTARKKHLEGWKKAVQACKSFKTENCYD